MGRRNRSQHSKSTQPNNDKSFESSSEDDNHVKFSEYLRGQLQSRNLCSNDEECLSIAEAIVSSAFCESPSESKEISLEALSTQSLDAAKSTFLDYFEGVVTECDAKDLIYSAALYVWGDGLAEISASLNHLGVENADENVTREDEGKSDDDEDDDGDFIGEGECELCERSIKLTRHHLIPRSTWPRMKKRIWNAAPLIESLNSSHNDESKHKKQHQSTIQEKQEIMEDKLKKILGASDLSNLPTSITHDSVRAYLNQVGLLCRQCHSAVHRIHTEWELAMEYNTVEKLLECDEVRKFAKWANKQRPGKFAL